MDSNPFGLGHRHRSSIWRHALQSTFHAPQEHGRHQSCSAWFTGLAVFVCLISWPLAIVVGWYIGDRNQVVVLDSMWTGLFPITNSPGFGLIALTLLPYLVGSVTMFVRPRKISGYLITIALR